MFQVQSILFFLNKKLFLETFNLSSFQQEQFVEDEGGFIKLARIRKAVFIINLQLFHHYNPACLWLTVIVSILNSLLKVIATNRYKQLEDAWWGVFTWEKTKPLGCKEAKDLQRASSTL